MSAVQEAVLYGLLFYGKTAWLDNVGRLKPELFTGGYRTLFEAAERRFRDGRPVDAATLTEDLADSEIVGRVMASFCSIATLPDYVSELRNNWAKGQAARIGSSLSAGDTDAAEAIDLLRELDCETTRSEYHDMAHVLAAWSESQEKEMTNPNPGIRTGWREVDKRLGGIRGGNLVIIAARPSMGKTAAALNIAAAQECRSLMFSLEMSEYEVACRLIAMQKVDHSIVRNIEDRTEEDWGKVTRGAASAHAKKILINDAGGISMDLIETVSEQAKRTHDIGLIIIDYLQLVTLKAESRFQVVSEVSRRLKALAKNLNVPVLALSQLNRAAEDKTAPTLSDLRESGQIEQDADQVLMIQRDEVINPEIGEKGTGTFYIRKNRHGETGNITLTWQGQFQRFINFQPGLN